MRTIETHEVWIIRRAVPEISGEIVTITPLEPVQPTAAVSPSSEFNESSEPGKEQES